jgi:hypothetical protein
VIYTDFYSKILSTNIAEGDFPEWNQVLEFPLVPDKKGECFTVKELEKSKTVIMLSVFDRSVQF